MAATTHTTRSPYPQPQGNLPLPLTFLPSRSRRVLIIGTNKLAAARAFTFLDSSFAVSILSSSAPTCDELKHRARSGQVEFVGKGDGPRWDDETDESEWRALLSTINGLSMVVVADTVLTATSSTERRSRLSAQSIFQASTSMHLPINTTDHPSFCTYAFPSVARFPGKEPGSRSNLQIAVSTNGKGCRLAGRIRRELVGRLPRGVGAAVDNVGEMRERVRATSPSGSAAQGRSSSCTRRARDRRVEQVGGEGDDDDLSLLTGHGPLNSPVPQLDSPALSRTSSSRSIARSDYFALKPSSALLVKPSKPDTQPEWNEEEENQLRRMRWVSQISEYWSIEYLARMGEEEMSSCLNMWGSEVSDQAEGGPSAGRGSNGTGLNGIPNGISGSNGINEFGGSDKTPGPPVTARHEISLTVPSQPPAKKGRILLLGSGPGHPSLLTVAAHQALNTATLILSDKLVPAEILALIPKTTTLHIAKKFPGNAEGAQNEMMQLALEGALRGEVVIRLKQGDPFIYGRGGEEVLFFRQHGFESVVVPGISSSIAGPLMMGIPVTQRGVAESMVLCTGVGRKGKAVQLPGYVRGRTLIVLMGVARIKQVLAVLTRTDLKDSSSDKEATGWREGAAFPPYLPIAIIERASSHDQRMVASTLEGIEDALERSGEQRPPGMMIIGWAALALEGEGEVTVLDDDEDTPDLEARDKARVKKWLGGQDYILRDGLNEEWTRLLPPQATVEEM